MSPLDLLNLIQKKSFEPFRIHVRDGTVYEIHHPELVMPGLTIAIVGIPADPSQPYFVKTEYVALNHIVRLEPLSKQSSPKNGQD